MRIISFDEFIDLPRPNIDWVVDGLIPRPGIVELMGPPKTGKSFLALDLALRVARGEPFLGRESRPQKVLYFQLDTSERVMKDRGLTLRASGYNTKADLFGMVHPEDSERPVDITMAAGKEYFRRAVAKHDPGLIIVDTLRECHQEDENESAAMKHVMDVFEDVFVNRAVFMVHHTNKLSPEISVPNPILASRGSTYITGKVDAFWLLYNGKLFITSRWDEPVIYNATQTENGMFMFKK
jgi:RecA-family ATPase